jgi:hypothetical protein
MAEVTFVDNSVQVKNAISSIAFKALEEVAGELEAQTKRNTAVDTGQTKNSWQHAVTGGSLISEYAAIVGSDYENAIWEEFGTGEYALEGNGRKGGWFYEDGKGEGHFTYGKHPRRPLWRAFTALSSKMVSHIQAAFAEGMK